MAGVDINRTTSGVNLPPEVSSEIWATTQEASAVMQLARQISLPGPGVSIPIITGDAAADWVDETDEKPVSRATLSNKTITPYKLAVIEPFSNEFRRDLPALYAELARRLPFALAKKFDATVFHASSAPGSNFDLLSTTTNTQGIVAGTGANTIYKGLALAEAAIAGDGGMLNGWALSPQARSLLRQAVDTTNRPLIFESTTAGGPNVPQLLGAPTYYSTAAYLDTTTDVYGYAGDWSSAVYGTVEGVQIAVTDTASITDGVTTLDVGEETVDIPNVLNLWQRNMFAVRAEIEIGFRVKNVEHFVKLTAGTVS
jgi:HK97 family phage major capsid protein